MYEIQLYIRQTFFFKKLFIYLFIFNLSSCGFFVRQVFIAISLILGDGLYNLIKIVAITIREMYNKSSNIGDLPVVADSHGILATSQLVLLIL